MIDELAILKIVVTLMGCWSMGFGIGKAVAWTRRIASVA